MSDLFGAELVDRYSRADALADGVLVDVTPVAIASGLTLPTAMTSGAHAALRCDEPVQLGRVMRAVRAAAAFAPRDVDRVHVELDDGHGRAIEAWACVGPGDDLRPVLTVMLEGED